jgi:hypothetical protein
MVQIFAAMKKEKYVLITKNALYVDTFKRQPSTHSSSVQMEGLTDFKRKGFRNFSSSPFSHILKNRKILLYLYEFSSFQIILKKKYNFSNYLYLI